MLTQQRRNTNIIMHVARLHRCSALPRVVGTEGREQTSRCLDSIGKEMFEVEAVLSQMIEIGSETDVCDRLVEKSSIQPFDQNHEHIGRAPELDARGRKPLMHERVFWVWKYGTLPHHLLRDFHGFIQRHCIQLRRSLGMPSCL